MKNTLLYLTILVQLSVGDVISLPISIGKFENSQTSEVEEFILNKTGNLMTTSIYFGTPLQTPENSTFTIDTSLSVLATTTLMCQNCTRKYYN